VTRPRALEIIAHRGYSAVAPENTLAALEAALQARADAVEFDVHVSDDGVPFLFHDDTLRRTTNGRGSVAGHTMAALKRLDAGAWFAPEFAGEPIPTLDEALALCRGRCGRVYPELKRYRRLEDVEWLVARIREGGWEGDSVLISLDWEALATARQASERIMLGYIVDAQRRFAAALELARADGNALVDCDVRLLIRNPGWAAAARAADVELATWTVDDPSVARLVASLGVRRLTTNQVERVRQALLSPEA
jgi:glycerophosphoryl diester phosphodiesterase